MFCNVSVWYVMSVKINFFVISQKQQHNFRLSHALFKSHFYNTRFFVLKYRTETNGFDD